MAMNEDLLLQLGRETMLTAMQVAAPMLIFGLVAGVTVSLFQAVTQIQESTLSFIPKILGVAVALLLFMPWMLQKLIHFTTYLFGDFKRFIE